MRFQMNTDLVGDLEQQGNETQRLVLEMNDVSTTNLSLPDVDETTNKMKLPIAMSSWRLRAVKIARSIVQPSMLLFVGVLVLISLLYRNRQQVVFWGMTAVKVIRALTWCVPLPQGYNCLTIYASTYPPFDGFGSQLLGWMSADVLAWHSNLTHCRTKALTDMFENYSGDGHRYGEMSNFLMYSGFIRLPLCADIPKCQGMTYKVHRWRIKKVCSSAYNECQNAAARLRLRSIFARTQRERSRPGTNSSLVVAIHIRRGDVDSQTNVQGRYTPNKQYEDSLRKVVSAMTMRSLSVHVYSNPRPQQVAKILTLDTAGLPTTWHLNLTAEQTFIALTLADVLISFKSSFGSSAAILNPNDVYFSGPQHDSSHQGQLSYFCDIKDKL